MAVALGDIGHESGIEYLSTLVEDPIPFVRGHTAIALAQIGKVKALPILEAVTQYTLKRAEESGNVAEKRMAEVCANALETLGRIVGLSGQG